MRIVDAPCVTFPLPHFCHDPAACVQQVSLRAPSFCSRNRYDRPYIPSSPTILEPDIFSSTSASFRSPATPRTRSPARESGGSGDCGQPFSNIYAVGWGERKCSIRKGLFLVGNFHGGELGDYWENFYREVLSGCTIRMCRGNRRRDAYG